MLRDESDGNGWDADEEVVHRTIHAEWQSVKVRLNDMACEQPVAELVSRFGNEQWATRQRDAVRAIGGGVRVILIRRVRENRE